MDMVGICSVLRNEHGVTIEFLDIYSKTIEDLKKLINQKIEDKSFTEENPEVTLTFFHKGELIGSRQAKMHTFTFQDMGILAQHNNEKHNINIVSCVTKEEIKKTAKEFMSDPNRNQMGIFFPITLTHPPGGHFVPMILTKENGKLSVYFGDSEGGDFLMAIPATQSLIDDLLSEEFGAEIYLDPIQRLEGSEGCASETLHWLIKGLRLKDQFTRSLHPIPSSFLPESTPDRYRNKIRTFLSAPCQLVTALPQNFKTTLTKSFKLDLDKMHVDSKKKTTLAQHLQKQERTIPFHVAGEEERTFSITYNHYLLHLSAKFKKVLLEIKEHS